MLIRTVFNLVKGKHEKVIVIVVLLILAVATLIIAIALYQINGIINAGSGKVINRDNYILISFELRESSGNALSTDNKQSQSLHFSYETIYIDVPETGGYERIKLDETDRKNLETELLALIEKHNLPEWNGFNEHLQVMDASNGFSLHVLYKNEDKIVASGGFVFPENYIAVFSDIKKVFVKYCN